MSNRPTRTLAAAAALLALTGCAFDGQREPSAWEVRAVQAVREVTGASRGYYLVGRYHDGLHEWDASIAAYRKAVTLDATHVEAWNGLGAALAQRHRLDEAAEALRTALKLDPRRGHVASNLGYVLLLSGRPDAALIELNRAAELEPTNATTLANLKLALQQIEMAPGVPQAATPVAAPAETVAAAIAAPAATASNGAQTVERAKPVTTVEVPAPLSNPAPQPELASATLDAPTLGALARIAPAADLGLQVRLPNSVTRVTEPEPKTAARTPDAPPRPTIELSNGNGIAGAATRLSYWLAHHGVKVDRLSNQADFRVSRSAVYYQPGHGEAAARVARALPRSVPVLPAPTDHPLSYTVSVVLGQDYGRVAACLQRNTCPAPVAVANNAAALDSNSH